MKLLDAFTVTAVILAASGCAESVTPRSTDERPGEPFLAAVAEGNGRFVGVGSRSWYVAEGDLSWYKPYSDTVVAVWSDDGVTWRESSLDRKGVLKNVAYGAGKFVAVGGLGDLSKAGHMLHSVDGMEWTQVTPNLDIDWRSIAFGKGFFLAAGEDWSRGGIMVIARSLDGTVWESVLEVRLYEANFVFGEDAVLLFGDAGGVARSEDGISWTGHPIPPLLEIRSVVHDGNGFVGTGAYDCCFGEVPDGRTLYTIRSADGRTWSVAEQTSTAFGSYVFGNGRYISFANEGIYSATTFGEWTLQRPVGTVNGFQESYGRPAFAQGRFVAGGRGNIVTSVNGSGWVTLGIPGDPTVTR